MISKYMPKAVFAAVLFLAPLAIHADEDTGLHIEPQPLNAALREFAERSGLQVMYAAEIGEGINSPGTSEADTNEEALDELLASTGLNFEYINERTVAIGEATDQRGASDSKNLTHQLALMAQNQASTSTSLSQTTDDIDENDPSESSLRLEEITVIGTSIRGLDPESSPISVFDREEIDAAGVATLQDFVRLLPQNFSGGSNPNIGSLPNDIGAGFNNGGGGPQGASVNLRGLGSGSTLVLLNGKRIAPSSGIGDFVDISLIPVSAVQRIEVLTDGASSIYGADAVAGVVNFVLRDDFEGLEASYRYGTVTSGDRDEHRASLTAGTSWNTGRFLAVYEYHSEDNLSAADRDFASGAQLPTDLVGSQERHSVLLSAEQDIGRSISVFSDFLYSTRDTNRDAFTGGFAFQFDPSSEAINATTGLDYNLGSEWFWDLSATYSALNSDIVQTRVGSSFARRQEAEVTTVNSKFTGPLFRVPAGDARIAVGAQYRDESFANLVVEGGGQERVGNREVASLFGELQLPLYSPSQSVPLLDRLELNLSIRWEDFSDFGASTNPKVGVLWAPTDGLRFRGTYSTSFNPPPLGRTSPNDLVGFIFANGTLGSTSVDPSLDDAVVLLLSGTDEDLEPEVSTSFTFGVDFDASFGRSNLHSSITYFDTDFEDRLGTVPIPGNASVFDVQNIAFLNPALFPAGSINFDPTAEQLADISQALFALISLTGDAVEDADIVTGVNLVRNLAATEVAGLDASVSLETSLAQGSLFLGLNGTYFTRFKRQASSSTAAVDQRDTAFNPQSLRLRGNVGYSTGGVKMDLFVNHAPSYVVDNISSESIDSNTTFDLSLSYDFGDRASSNLLSNLLLRFSALNVLDNQPPRVPDNPGFGIFGYDPTNASPLGRVLSLELRKHFL